MKQEVREYLTRLTSALKVRREQFIERRVEIQGEKKDALTALLTRSPVLLLGGPGSGKTTLLRMAALACVTRHREESPIPFVVEVASKVEPSPSTDLAAWLADAAMFDPPQPLLNHLLKVNRCIILIDGLDELPFASRDDVVGGLRRWMVEYSGNHWVLSSRPIGRPAFPDLADEAFLVPLSAADISRAVGIFSENEREAEELRQVLLSHEYLTSLAATPLLLRLLMQIYQEQKTLPTARADLYGSWADIALRRWDKTRGIGRRSDYLSLEVTRQALSRLALNLSESSRFTFELSDWFLVLREFQKIDDDGWESAELTFSENLLGSGLVRAIGPTDFAFAHLTLQEYFASQALLSEAPEDALRILKRIPLDGVAAFYAELSPEPMETARFLMSVGRLDDLRRLLDAFPGLNRHQRQEIVVLFARTLGIEQVLFREAPEREDPPTPVNAKERLRELWHKCCTSQDPNKKGQAFERFATRLFGEVFKVVDIRRLTSFGEIDLICEVKADSFWIRWPGDCFVECKNLSGAVSLAVANEFVGKCSTVRVGLAFLVCAGKLTKPAYERLARSWSHAESPDMAWIDGGDIEEWLEGPVDAESFLKSVVRRASYGTH